MASPPDVPRWSPRQSRPPVHKRDDSTEIGRLDSNRSLPWDENGAFPFGGSFAGSPRPQYLQEAPSAKRPQELFPFSGSLGSSRLFPSHRDPEPDMSVDMPPIGSLGSSRLFPSHTAAEPDMLPPIGSLGSSRLFPSHTAAEPDMLPPIGSLGSSRLFPSHTASEADMSVDMPPIGSLGSSRLFPSYTAAEPAMLPPIGSLSSSRLFPSHTAAEPDMLPPIDSLGSSRLFPSHTASEPDKSVDMQPMRRRSAEELESLRETSRRGDRVALSWQDLWVSASDGKGGRISILSGLNGYAQPGEVLAIMGPSGCGKSTLLDTLAGRLQSNVSQSGEILVNGQKQTLAFGTSAYVTQDDILMTTLTVKEVVYYSAQLQLPESMSISEKRERAEETLREMGLRDAMNTRIGGWASKGISGGQKRRVSICIEILKRPDLLFLDEPTSGLDSAASYHVMSRIAGLARREGMTVVASIHQPSSEVFELFHSLCLLAYGKTVYFGPPSEANEFFALSGFPCPSLRNPSDHYLRTINKDFEKDIEKGPEAKQTTATEAIETLVKSYRSSSISQQVAQRISEIRQMVMVISYGNNLFINFISSSKRITQLLLITRDGPLVKKRSHASFLTQSLVLTRRSFINMYRDLGYYWLRFAIYIALCLCVGTIFYHIGHSYGSIQARGSVLMFVAAFLTFMAIGGFPSFVEDMKIFGRERLNGHYGVTTFVIGNTVSSTPYLALISVVPGAMAYYLVGLQKGFEHFAYFCLVLFACMMLVESLMMIVASIVPDFLMGIITGAGIQGVMMLNGGFFRLPNDLPKPVWRYPMYYIAFHKYAFQGFYKNEFKGLTFPNNQAGGPSTITGDEILKEIWQVETGYSKWVDLAILFGMVLLYRFMFLAIIKITERAKPMIKALLVKPPKESTRVMEEPSDAHAP